MKTTSNHTGFTKSGRSVELDSEGFWTMAAGDLEVGDMILLYPFPGQRALSRTVEVEDVLRLAPGMRTVVHAGCFELEAGPIMMGKSARVRLEHGYARDIVA